jgi:hypothetical protein
MKNQITLQDIEIRLAALERVVASLTAEKNKREPSDDLDAKFAQIGGKKVGHFKHDAPEGSQSVDMSEAYGSTGKRVG